MKVEIYGIPHTLHNCWGCVHACKLLDENGIGYDFYPVLLPSDNELGFQYDRPRIEELAKRVGRRSLAFSYPQIFVDGDYIGGYKHLLDLIGD